MKTLAIRNGLWNASATALGIVTGVLGSLIIPRSLPTAEAYGLFSYYLWLGGIISFLGTLSLPNALTKIRSELRGQDQQGEAQSLAQSIVLMLLLINGLLAGGLMLWAMQQPMPHQILLIIVALYVLPSALAAALRSTLMADERYRPLSVITALGSVMQLVLIVVADWNDWGVPGFVAAMLFGTASQVVGLLLVAWHSSLRIRLRFSFPSRATWKQYGSFLLPSTLALIATQIVWERSEVFFFDWFDSGLDQIGFYGLAYTLLFMFFMMGGALLNAFFPAISHDYGAGNWDSIRTKVNQGAIVATLYAVPISFGAWATLDQLVPLIFTEKMQPAADVARILFIGMVPATIGIILGTLLGASGGIWASVRIGVVLSITNIVLDIILIPRWQAMGGATANTGSQIIYTLLMWIAIRRRYAIDLPWASIGSIVLVGAVTTLLVPLGVRALLPDVWGLLLAIGLAGVLYVASIWFLGYLKLLVEAPRIDVSETPA